MGRPGRPKKIIIPLSGPEEEEEMPSTPKSKRKSPTKAKTPSPKKRRSLPNTALPQRTQQPVESETPFERARKILHVSAVPEYLPCRENETSQILSYVQEAIKEKNGTCIYISGTPGTGKTASVREIIRVLQGKVDTKDLNRFKFTEINALKLSDPLKTYCALWESLSEEKVTADHANSLLEEYFKSSASKNEPWVVFIDELDMLVANQSLMYNLFNWPNVPNSRLILIAVANTMDLPERMTHKKISSRIGLTRINFTTYNHQQLIKILESRLEGIETFEKDAIEFAARKVSAFSGDARRALDICRRAVEILESNLCKTSDSGVSTSTTPKKQVTIAIVDKAIKEMLNSPSVTFVRRASLHQKLFLWSIIETQRQKGADETEFREVVLHHETLCMIHDIEKPPYSDLFAICSFLCNCAAIFAQDGRRDIYRRIRLNCVSEDDIILALKQDSIFKNIVK
ncbi:5611_t:CDS:2 [Ambispora gerdemannii]|uniref:Origin recognition complex subunit 1 n=1 Tax=Ambispora gerdemannii TaxID=144530 RepID=A0A9N9EVY2_9GLOM|nr:5611_t:CDS:2 [Ambispora gerdemannii]